MLGKELIINGGFDADTDWALGDGWSIASGVAHCDGSQIANSFLAQSNVSKGVIGLTYRIQFTLSNRASGWIALILGGVTTINYSSNDTYIVFVKVVNVGQVFNLRADPTFVGDIDNISIREDIPIGLSRTGHRFSSFPEN